MNNYTNILKDQLESMKVRKTYVKIILLDFEENKIKDIQGIVTQGSINVNGNAAIRRTLTLTMLAFQKNTNIENINNLISLNKKIKVEIGYNSPVPKETGDIVWFPMGTYVIEQASSSTSLTGITINITAKDKMVLLDGTVGGTFPSTVTFHEYEEFYTETISSIIKPTFYEIIREAVHTYGDQPYEKIHIFDLDLTAFSMIKYTGESKLMFREEYTDYLESDEYQDLYPYVYTPGEDIGYLETKLTSPQDLVFSAGDNVVSLLNKIVNLLGNYEFFFDLDGNFVFQQKKNCLHNEINSLNDLTSSDYLKAYSSEQYEDIIDSDKFLFSLSTSPKYNNIKNDFIVWGNKNVGNNINIGIRYHLLIEKRPELNLCKQYMYEKDLHTGFFDYEFLTLEEGLKEKDILKAKGEDYTLIGYPCLEWREELYRQALVRQGSGIDANYLDAELLAEWRNLYSTTDIWAYRTLEGYYEGWNYELIHDPLRLKYWLEFLDGTEFLEQYSISAIGKRTKIVNNSECHALFYKAAPELIFSLALDSEQEEKEKIKYYESKGQKICFVTSDFYNSSLSVSSTGISCYDIIKDLLYQHLVYQTAITITCLPKPYLEPNTLIYINNLECGLQGRYVINSLTIPLNYNGTMSISAVQALTKF